MAKETVYRRALDRVEGFRCPAQPDDEAGFEVWAALVEADSAFAGLLTTAVNHGGFDSAQLAQVRRSLEQIHPPPGRLAKWREVLRSAMSEVESGSGRWARERPVLLDLCRAWKADLETRDLVRNAVVELDPESASEGSWNWFLSFDLDGTEFEALVIQDLSGAVFEDGTGLFDDHVKLEDIPAYLERRLKQPRSVTG